MPFLRLLRFMSHSVFILWILMPGPPHTGPAGLKPRPFLLYDIPTTFCIHHMSSASHRLDSYPVIFLVRFQRQKMYIPARYDATHW
jgi:hypothetical protein